MLHCVKSKNTDSDKEKSAVDLMMTSMMVVKMMTSMMGMKMVKMMKMMKMMKMVVMTSSNVRLCRASKERLKRTTKRKRQRLAMKTFCNPMNIFRLRFRLKI